MNKIQKDQKPNCHFWGVGSKAGYWACTLHTAPPRGWGRPPKPPLRPDPGSVPTLTPFKAPACPPPTSEREQGHLLFVFAPMCYSTSPNKALPEFLIWPLINFYWLKSPRTQLGYTYTLNYLFSVRRNSQQLPHMVSKSGKQTTRQPDAVSWWKWVMYPRFWATL